MGSQCRLQSKRGEPEGTAPEIEGVLTSNYLGASPNPFNPSTSVQFGLVKAGNVEIDVFDIRGHHVVNLQTGFMEAGRHSVLWRGMDAGQRRVSSGVFFIRLVGEGFELTNKVLLMK
jgi:hypothetical protein